MTTTNDLGTLLDAMQRILATGHRLSLEQTGQDQYVITAQLPIDDYGFTAKVFGNTISHPLIDLADRIAPGAK